MTGRDWMKAECWRIMLNGLHNDFRMLSLWPLNYLLCCCKQASIWYNSACVYFSALVQLRVGCANIIFFSFLFQSWMSCREISSWFSTSLRLSSNFPWFSSYRLSESGSRFEIHAGVSPREWINLVEFASEKWKKKEDLLDFGAREKKIDFGESWSSCEGQESD